MPPDKGDTIGTYATTTRHSPTMLTRSSTAAFCDEVVCHVQATSLPLPHYLEPLPTVGLHQGHYARTRPSSPIPPTKTTNKPAPRLHLFNPITRARICTFLTSQRSTAVSIDTCNAVVRFPGLFWSLTCSRVGVIITSWGLSLGFRTPFP